MSNGNYFHYDVTPDGERNEFNCVTRAIKVATGLPYDEVRDLLKQNAKEHDCEKLVCDCYSYLLEDVFGYEYHDCGYKYTVQEIANMYCDDIVLMRIDGHLTISVYGVSVDIFDCTNELCDCFWIVGRR